jgi:RHS repeat-associated protein
VGSNSVVARSDGAVQKTFFRPFGEFAQSGSNLTPYLFTDQEHDPETSLQYFGARYYDPWVGRFLEQDPALIGPAEGLTFLRVPTAPQNLNSSSYAVNNPTRFVDPTGESILSAFLSFAESVGHLVGGRFDQALNKFREGKNDLFNSTGVSMVENGSLGEGPDIDGAAKTATEVVEAGNVAEAVLGPSDQSGNPLEGTETTEKVDAQMENAEDTHHSFPVLVESLAEPKDVTTIKGDDGKERTKVSIPGSVNGEDGDFVFIIEPDGKTINHRQFEKK